MVASGWPSNEMSTCNQRAIEEKPDSMRIRGELFSRTRYDIRHTRSIAPMQKPERSPSERERSLSKGQPSLSEGEGRSSKSGGRGSKLGRSGLEGGMLREMT